MSLESKTKAGEALATVDGNPSNCFNALTALRRTGSDADVKEFIQKFDITWFDYLRPKPHYHDFSAFERECVIEVGNMIAQTPASSVSLLRAVDYVIAAGIPGALVECGVFMGGSEVLMAKALLRRGVMDRDIYLYDTFMGMPKPTEHDIGYNGYNTLDHWDPSQYGAEFPGCVFCPIEKVQENVRRAGYPQERFHFVKGLVEETIPKVIPDRIALLRLDTDYYESTKHELEHLFPRLERGGILVIDDYGAFQGARKAVDEYFKARGTPIFLSRIDEHVRLAVKLT